MKTALIILNYNNANDTRCCIESIMTHNTAPVKIVVVDNASRPEVLEQVRADLTAMFGDTYHYYASPQQAPATLPDVTLVSTGANIGYARGNNVGIGLTYADPEVDFVMILNNDILFVDDIIPTLTAKYRALPDCAIISPVLYKRGLKEYDHNCARRNMPVGSLIRRNFMHYWWRLRGRDFYTVYPELFMLNEAAQASGGVMPIELPSGSCMLIDKGYFKEIGGFDPATFLYYEENILYKKIERTGRRNYLSLTERCIHLGASTMQQLPSSLRVIRESRRSERYYVKRYSGAPAPLRWLHDLSTRFFMLTFSLQKLCKH